MRKRFAFKSIYAKFTIIFLGIWWLLNSLTFGIVIKIMSNSVFSKLSIDRIELYDEFFRIRRATGLTFLVSAIIGTVIILLAVRGIVKPIQYLSKASKEISKGNFDVELKIKSLDEIGQLTTDFNVMTQGLKSIDILRKDFVSNVSHEFRTPITSIMGFAKLIRGGQISEEQVFEYCNIIVKESERLSLLSSNLLKISELDSKAIHEEASKFSLSEQIRKTILILQVQWEKKGIEFDLDLHEVIITGNEHLLQEVWLNLIQNGIKFSNPKGVISINLQKYEDKVKVIISDQGIGMIQEDKKRIFERFYKGDKSRSKDGNGLGLVIVKKIVELSNGKIYFESEQGKGSIFIVELPIIFS